MPARTLAFAFSLLLLLSPGALRSQDVALYDDPRVMAWSALWLEGDGEAVLASVEEDLRSGSPHPFAPHVWSVVHLRSGTLEDRLASLGGDPLRSALGPMPEIALLYRSNRYWEAARSFPLEEVAALSDPWAPTYLGWSASSRGDDVAETEFMLLAAAAAPGSYQAAWSLSANFVDASSRERIAAAVAPGGVLAGTPSGELLAHRLAFQPAMDLDDLSTLDAWLETRPRDARALGARAAELSALQRWDEAAESRRAAFVAYPFFTPFAWVTALVRAGRTAEARDTLERYFDLARPWGETRTRDADLEVEWVQSLVAAGEKGQAREALTEALAQWPEDPGLNNELAGLDLEHGRNLQALEASRRAAASGHVAYQENFLQALVGSGSVGEAVEHLGTLEQSGEPNERWYWRVASGLAEQERYAEAIAITERGLALLPNSDLLHRTGAPYYLADRRAAEGLEHLTRSLSLYRPYSWSVSRFVELHEALDEDGVDAALEALAAEYSWVEDVWAARARRSGSVDGQEAVWREAVTANPGRMWPWAALIERYERSEDWARAWAVADEAEVALDSASPAVMTARLEDRGMLAASHAFNGRPGPQYLEEGLRALEEYRSRGGLPAIYHRRRGQLLRASGEAEAAADAFLAAMDYEPGDYTHIGWLFGSETTPAERFRRVHRYVMRDPYDGLRLERGARRHGRWGGSKIIALQLLQLMEERDPDHFARLGWLEDEVIGGLGAHHYSYERSYASGRRPIGASENYIRWFERARRAAQGVSADVTLDASTGVLTRVHPDGQVELRQDHPVTGRPVLVQVGAAFVRSEYDESGENLLAVYNSAGRRIELEYNSAGRAVGVVELQDGVEERRLTYAFNDEGRVARIEVSDVGAIDMSYDATGEISARESEGGPSVAVQVTRSMQRLLGLVQQFQEADASSAPDLPYRDPVLDEIRGRHEAAPSATTALELAAYLVEHVADRAAYADDAFSLTEELMRDAQEGTDPMSGVTAVGLWYDLASQVRPRGLGAEAWVTWSQALEWVQRQALGGIGATQATALLNRVAEAPLRRLDRGRWLPRSRLANPAFWRRYTNAELFPPALAPTALPSTLVVRNNGDVVVGSDRGLSVLRRGYWEWFGFAETFGSFSADADPVSLRATSDVRALVEDETGRLWVGTGNGLILVAGDYEDPVTRWVTPEQGLPVPAVDHLAPRDGGVLAGTARGLRFFDGSVPGQPVDGALASDAITFLAAGAAEPPPLAFDPVASGAGEATALAYGPQDLVAVGGSDGRVHVWSTRSREVVAPLGGVGVLDGSVSSLAFSADGSRLVAGSSEGEARVWEAGVWGQGVLLRPAALDSLGDYRLTVRIDIPRGEQADTIQGDLADTTLDPASDGPAVDPYTVEVGAGSTLTARVRSDAFDTYLVVASPSGETWTNDDYLGSTSESFVEVSAEEAGTWSVDVSAFGGTGSGAYELILTTARVDRGEPQVLEGSITASDAVLDDTGEWYDGMTYHGHVFQVPEGARLTVGMDSDDLDPFLRVTSPAGTVLTDDYGSEGFDALVAVDVAEAGEWVVQAMAPSSERVVPTLVAAAFLPSGEPVTVDWNGLVHVWDAAAGTALRRFEVGDREALTEAEAEFVAAFSPDGSLLAATEGPSSVGIWSVADGSLEASLGTSDAELGSYRVTTWIGMLESLLSETLEGALEDSDARRGERFADVYPITVPAGTEGAQLRVTLTSEHFDTYLYLDAPSGEDFENDDFGSTEVSSLRVGAEPGEWTVTVTSYTGGETGAYALEVELDSVTWGEPVVTEATLSTEDGGILMSGPYQPHEIELAEGQTLRVEMAAEGMTPLLALTDPWGERWYADDTGPGTQELVAPDPAAGVWQILAGADHSAPAATAVAFGADGKLALGDTNGRVRVLDWRTGEAAGPTVALDEATWSVVLGPDGKLAALMPESLVLSRNGQVTAEIPVEDARGFAMAPDGSSLATISMDDGLRAWDADDGEPLRVPAPVLVGTPTGLSGVTDAGQTILAEGQVLSAYWHGVGNAVYLTRTEPGGQDGAYVLDWNGVSAPGGLRRVMGQEDIVRARQTYGVAPVPLDSATTGVGVLTDQGISVYHDYHFEHVDLPQLLAEDRPGVRAAANRGERAFFLTSEGVFSLDGAAVGGDNAGRVYGIVSSERWGATFIARGTRLDVVFHDATDEGPQVFARLNATHLALTADHALVVNDGQYVRRYAVGETTSQQLFRAAPMNAEGQRIQSELTSLMVDSDGVVWATAGPGLFRYDGADQAPREFNLFLDPQVFDSRSDWLSRVLETVDGRIWVVASNEGYRTHDGMRLEGGLLEWNGDGFTRLELPDQTNYWFITGYTAISDDAAIVGTNRGFAEHRGDRLSSFYDMNDASYAALREREPYLILGRRGAPIDDETWIFPTASGIVALQRGQWFYPDRINRMLPDPHLSQYGGRTVHAVSADGEGRIYAGTDRGLLIFDTGGEDGAAFLVSNRVSVEGLAYQEHRKFREEASRLLAAVDPESDAGQLVARFEESRKALEELQLQMREGAVLPGPAPEGVAAAGVEPEGTGAPSGLSDEEVRVLRRELDRRQRAHGSLLQELEQDHFSLYQMLELKPLDLAALREDIPQGEAVVQYLPLEDRLLVHLVTTDDVTVREVSVGSEELQARARRVSQHLRAEAQQVRGENRSRLVGGPQPLTVEDLDAELAWLYDMLLRPVEPLLTDKEHIYVAAVGALTALPFAALRRESKSRTEFAVERYAFGYLPSMYLLDLVLRHEYSLSDQALVMGNPDGTLPGAEVEAQAVHATLLSDIPVQIGQDASFDNLLRYVGEARVLHLATHGDLRPEAPTESTLLLANDYVITPVDIMELPLDEADLVVLSACETGLGTEGHEYATLARSFAHAGAASMVATLWLVPDEPSRILMERFYEELADGSSAFQALAEAQRAMIRGSEEAYRAPAAWSGYATFGKPVYLDGGF